MKLLVGLVIIMLAFVAIAERPSIPVTRMDWSTPYVMPSISTVATKKDLLVYLDTSAPDPVTKKNVLAGPVMAVRRRNAEGVYVPVGNFTEAASQYSITNGRWVALLGNSVALFKVNENNTFSDLSVIPFPSVTSGFLLSDDTFVGYDSIPPLNDGNYTIRTFRYEASNNTWQEIPEAGLVIPYVAFGTADSNTYHVSDTHLVILDYYTNSADFVVNIFERQANKSWQFVDSVPVTNTGTYINYNDVDTLTLYAPISDESGMAVGVLFVYTKVNSTWTEQKFTTTSVGWRRIGYFGLVTSFLDVNNLLIGAPYEGINSQSTGKVLLLTRTSNDELWEPSAEGNGGLNSFYFGTGIGVNDYDVVIASVTNSILTYYSAPRCFYQPINVTCNNQQVNDCSQVDLTSLYTVNNPQCGAVSARINGFSIVDNKVLEAQFSFAKSYSPPTACNATVTCPVRPPIAVIQQAPSKVSSAVGVQQFGIASLFGFVTLLL